MASSDLADVRGHQLAMQLRAAYAHLRRGTSLALDDFGMTSDQYVLLTVLAEEGELTQQALGRRCSSDTATIGTMVVLLESKGLVSREPHPRDARARCVRLTPKGRALAVAMRRASATIRRRMVALFDDHELTRLVEALARLAAALSPAPRRRAAVFHRGSTPHAVRKARGPRRPTAREIET